MTLRGLVGSMTEPAESRYSYCRAAKPSSVTVDCAFGADVELALSSSSPLSHPAINTAKARNINNARLVTVGSLTDRMAAWHVAQVNIARLLQPVESPKTQEFIAL